jgi:FkbM family methyltransferase
MVQLGRRLILDVGASYGYYTISMADLISSALGEIHSFEPDPRCFTALRRSAAESKLPIQVNQALVGETIGMAKLFFSSRASTSNRSFHSEGPAFRVQNELSLESLTLTDYAKDIPVEGKAVIITVDVEGSELRVLRGASGLLARARGFAIQYEWYPFSMKGSGIDVEEFIDHIRAIGLDWAFVNDDGKMYRLDGIDHLIANMRTHEMAPDRRGIGTAAEYLIGQGITPPALADAEAPAT